MMPTSENVHDKRFKRLSLCEMLSLTASIYCSGMKVFSLIVAVCVAVDAGVWAILLLVIMPSLRDFDVEELSKPEYLLANTNTVYRMLLLRLAVTGLVSGVSSGAMIRPTVDLYMRKEPDVTTCLMVGAKFAPIMSLASILSLLGIAMGYAFLVVPGVYLEILWFLQFPIIVIEGMGALPSFKRSSDLVSGSWCYVLCYVYCTYMVCVALTLVARMAVVTIFGTDGSGAVFSIKYSTVNAMPSIALKPVIYIMMTVMYLNLRIEKEDLNFDILARNMEESGAADAAAYSPLMSNEPEDGV